MHFTGEIYKMPAIVGSVLAGWVASTANGILFSPTFPLAGDGLDDFRCLCHYVHWLMR